jgi:predicted transposase/invertase (TIGR01784 family)
MNVRVININEGRNAEIARKCKTLAQYSAFVEKVRSYEKMGMKLVKAIKRAVEYCLEHDILKEFLEQNSRRVVNMVKTQWNLKDEIKWNRKEGREEGFEEGIEKGRVEIARNALMNGLSIDLIHTITGLDTDAIKNLGASAN